MQEEDYYQLTLEKWSKFYSYCIQYHEVRLPVTAGKMEQILLLLYTILRGKITSYSWKNGANFTLIAYNIMR